jgi:hypothetical protein
MNARKARAEKAEKQTAKGGGGTVEQQIKALHSQLMEATLKHDPGFLEKYLADDYMAIRNDGKLTTKVQEIENYKSGVTKYESIEIREATVGIHRKTVIYKFPKSDNQRETIQRRRSQHTGLDKTERQLENSRVSGDTSSPSERVSQKLQR